MTVRLVEAVRRANDDVKSVHDILDSAKKIWPINGHLPEEVRNSRRDRLLAIQQPIAFAWSQAQVGRRMDVILDGGVPGERHAFVGRSYADAPEVDGTVYVSGKNLVSGQIVACEIVASRGYDLIAAAVE